MAQTKMIDVFNQNSEIITIAEAIKSLNAQAYAVYEPMVADICTREFVNENEIEHLLDGLVSVCTSDDMTELFKKVCRKFYNQYPEMITDYILFYKEMYGEDKN